ncbi:MAG: YceI family protein [Bacteroidales bacterium]|nr:YceI family protein [Bacteroidales bacterium]MBK8882706.1 YceI family protein [Bacteroidales bacterium]
MSTTEKTKWALDPSHSEIAFKVKHLMITNVKGVFKDFSASVTTTGGDFTTSEIEFSLNPASVDTGAVDRDNHLRSADFFDVEKYGRLSFSGKKAEKADNDGNYILHGDLTIKDVTKPVKLNVEFAGVAKDPWGNEKAGYTITGKIHRKDFGLNWNAALEAGGVLVSEDVTISCDVQLVKQG